jgi:acyl-CoA synthetase (NDP forming)
LGSALAAFKPLFEPTTIAVVGASASGTTPGNRFIGHLKAYGYPGRIWPIHPSATAIEGLPAFKSVAATPDAIDYAYVAIAAPHVPKLVRTFAGRVRVAQVISSGFGETVGGEMLEAELLKCARESGVRIIGPNCLGIHSPRARVTFTERTTSEAGRVGIVCQSGGLGVDIARRGQNRGLRFSGLVTVGNCIDVRPSELVEYFLESPDTAVIGLYVEGVGDGRRLFEVLRAAQGRKPVVILKGGRTEQGRRAASSHTGALASAAHGWRALAAQTGAVLVDHLDAFLDALLAFQCLALRDTPTRGVILFGNGGGTSVLGTDAFAEAGFDVGALESAVVRALEDMQLPAGSSVTNPIDVPASALQKGEGKAAERIIEKLYDGSAADVIVMHINMTAVLSYRDGDMLGNLMNAALAVRSRRMGGMHLVLALRSDGDTEVEDRKREWRQRAAAAGIPVFDELVLAASALACVRDAEEFRARERLLAG